MLSGLRHAGDVMAFPQFGIGQTGFTVDGYRDRLARMHERIRARGPFVSHAQRFLIEAHKPRSTRGG